MSSIHSYTFHNMDRIGTDSTDLTQKNLFNSRSSDYMLSNYFSQNKSDNHVNFATSQPTLNFNAVAHGAGINGDVVDGNFYFFYFVHSLLFCFAQRRYVRQVRKVSYT